MDQASTKGKMGQSVRVDRAALNALLRALADAGFTIVGPTVRDGAIVYGEIQSDTDFPVGLTDAQAGGHYRVAQHSEPTVFSFAASPNSLKSFLYPSRSLVYRANGSNADFTVECPQPDHPTRYAFVGVRACDLHAMAIQDKVFMEGAYVDPIYAKRRASAFIVAVNCAKPAGTCFCVSMGTGPKATVHFDLALTEICEDGQHYFVVECGSAQGAAVLEHVPHRSVQDVETQAAAGVVRASREMMERTLDINGVRELFYRNAQSPRWEETATRCLACANCTMVCPTCFCSTVEDTTNLTGDNAERWRVWDSCFTIDFSHIHGGSVRKSGSSRYRHWITHKLATWHDQFGTSGCVGCGRCITWCPVGIDITEEVAALRQAEAQSSTPKREEDHARNERI